jgi:hypothetical protein
MSWITPPQKGLSCRSLLGSPDHVCTNMRCPYPWAPPALQAELKIIELGECKGGEWEGPRMMDPKGKVQSEVQLLKPWISS